MPEDQEITSNEAPVAAEQVTLGESAPTAQTEAGQEDSQESVTPVSDAVESEHPAILPE